MKGRKAMLKANLFKILLAVMILSVGLWAYGFTSLYQPFNHQVSHHSLKTEIYPVKKYRIVNRAVTWMSANINKRKGGNFWKERKKSASLKYNSRRFASEEAGSSTSNYDYKGVEDQTLIEEHENVIRLADVEVAAVHSVLPDASFEIPPEISMRMTASQNQSVLNLTANMSFETVIFKLNEDEAFKESMQNASGLEITKEIFGPGIKP